MEEKTLPPGFQDMLSFGLIEALLGRRSRRFFRGTEIPNGVFKYKSKHEPMPQGAEIRIPGMRGFTGTILLRYIRKFPATVPAIFSLMYLLAHHLDLDHYDKFYKPGEYLHTHKTYMEQWHGKWFFC